nr:helix-turn-helix domain-containing protein [Vicinamibacterales bacterium]
MPGFADNLRRACEAAGITVAEAARRLGTKPADVEAWLAAGSLPELHVLVRLADGIGCRADDLLLGEDADFAHPQRRHAGLISARMGRVRVLLTQVRLARYRGELTLGDEAEMNEAALLATVEGCRAWVMSEDHDVGVAAAIEAELDGHLERVAAVLARVQRPAASAFPPAMAVAGASGGGEGQGAAPAPAGAGADTPA